MAGETSPPQGPAVDQRSGYSPVTRTFHSLRPAADLLPEDRPLSAAAFALSCLPSTLPSPPALVDAATGDAISYPEFLSQIRSLAAGLRSAAGLAAGDVAFVLSPARAEVPVLYLALLSIGAVVSPANPLGSPGEIAHQIGLAKPQIAFATAAVVEKLPRRLPILLLDSPDFKSLLSSSAPAGGEGAPVRQSDTAAILFSSGTTGRVKGVELTHRNLIATALGWAHAAKEEEEEPASVALFAIHLFHVFGFLMVLRCVVLGETAVLMESFNPSAMLGAVERFRVTWMPVSPPVVAALANSGEASRFDLSSLRRLTCGGAPLGRQSAERFAARFHGVEIAEGYGLTEVPGGVALMVGPEEVRVYGSVGRLGPMLEAKIVDPITGEALGPAQRGELWVRGPRVMKGYIGDAEATASTLDPKGWLKTGDLCYFDHDGFLFIVDRLKELIKYMAFQVPPAELELILHSHPEIADAAVIPYPDEDAGQIPMAFVVRQPGSYLSEEQVMNFVAKQVAPHMKIRRVAFISSIPKSPTGKILRRELSSCSLFTQR